jgi:hypothetical protein
MLDNENIMPDVIPEDDNIPEEFIEEEAVEQIMAKPSPKLQSYIDKYNDVEQNIASDVGVGGAKRMLDDYKNGILQQKYPDLTDEDIISSIDELENNRQQPDDTFLSKVMDVPKQIVGGFRDAAQSIIGLVQAGGDEISAQVATRVLGQDEEMVRGSLKELRKNSKVELPEVDKAKSIGGSLTRGVSQFLAPFGMINKAGKGLGIIGNATGAVGKFAEAAAAGAVTDFIAFDEHEQRLSNLIEQSPTLSNPVTAYLKADPTDSVAEGRFKNAVEGLALGGLAEGFFKVVKAIKGTKEVKGIVKEMSKEVESRTILMDKSYDSLLDEIKEIPLRNKKHTTLLELSKSAEKVKWTKEDLLNGTALENLDAKSTQPLAIKATLIQEEAFGDLLNAIPDYRSRIEIGDSKAIDNYWGEMVELHKLDFVAKDIAAKHGGAESMVYRRHSTAVSQANAMYKIFDNADSFDKRRMVEMHMSILESKSDLDGFIQGITSTAPQKIKQVLKSIYMANILSSPATHFKNIVATSFNGLVYTPLERAVGAAISTVRKQISQPLQDEAGQRIANGFFGNIEDGIQWKESQILFHSQFSAIIDGIGYLGRALIGQTDTLKAAKANGVKRSRLKDISDTAKRSRFDSGSGWDNVANNGFDALRLGIKKEGIIGTSFYHLANLIGKYTQVPGSLIQTYDDAVKGMFFKAQVEAQTYRLAAKEGLSGEALKTRWKELYQIATFKPNLSDEVLSQMPRWMREESAFSSDGVIKNIQDDALDFSAENTFTKQMGELGQSIQKGRDALDKVMHIIPGGSIILPFVKTPVNLFKYFAIDRGPLSPLTQKFWSDIKAGGSRSDMAMARFGTGTALLGSSYYLALNGYVYGDGPKDPATRNFHQQLGIQPRSVRVGDKFYDLGWMDPVASFIFAPANIMEVADRLDNDIGEDLWDTIGKYTAATSLALSEMMLSKTAMMGLSEVMSAITDQNDHKLKTIIYKFTAAAAVPNFVSYIGQTLNPIVQETDTLWETIKAKAGFDTHARRDIFGRVVYRNPKINNYMVPISYSEWKNDHTVAKVIAAGAYIGKPKRNIDGVRLSLDQYDQLMQHMEKQDVYGQVDKLVSSSIFNTASNSGKAIDEEGDLDYTKKTMIQLVYGESLKIAKQKVLSDNPDLKKEIFEYKLKAFIKPAVTTGDNRILKNLAGLNKPNVISQ